MFTTEWKLEDALVIERMEGFEEGIELFSNLMSQAKSIDELKRMFETSVSQRSCD